MKASKGSWSNWMLKDEHKHWKVKTVTSLPIAFIDFICISDQMSNLSASWESWHAQVSLPAGKWAMGKLKFENSILWLLWIQRRKHGPPLWTGSMDPLSLACARLSDSIVQTYLPSPRAFFAFFFFWTTFHHYLGAWNRLPVMGQVHGNFYIFIERFWFFLNNENWKKKTEIVQKYDLTRRCRSLL